MIPCSSILAKPPLRSSEPRQTTSRTLPRTTSGMSLSSFRRFGPTRPRYGSPGQVEAQFFLARITQDRTRYDYVVAHLDARYANEVRDNFANPPTANLYEHLKTELILRLSLSEDQKVRQLQSAELAERKPSQLLHHMRALAGNMEVPDYLLRALWLQ
ncbi:hypothetical protein HPB49_001839 [Dermacentor silvarum]|uniref:Uncharacterized protein n=1 Tax=Dermacentor silvarum TaxID=543639 RepID=A0ACB8D256_DERSI|nr:hypothetical protein HPB49_001839 [Dermacentor silvarum]